MDKPKLARPRMRTLTVGALLALFVGAAVVALVSRLLPGGLSGVVARKLRASGDEPGSGEIPVTRAAPRLASPAAAAGLARGVRTICPSQSS